MATRIKKTANYSGEVIRYTGASPTSNMMKIYTPGGAPAGPSYTSVDASDFINWRLNEPAGSTTFASSVNTGASTNLTIDSTSKFASGVNNGSFQTVVAFQGDADTVGRYLRGAAGSVPTSASSFSVSMWIKPYSNRMGPSGAGPLIFSKFWHAGSNWSAPYSAAVTFGLDGAGGLGMSIPVNGVGWVSLSTSITNNEIALISATFDGNYAKLYKNGVLISTSSNLGNKTVDFGNGPWYSGKASVGFPGHSYDGEIWDIRLANGVRSQAYYASMYDTGT